MSFLTGPSIQALSMGLLPQPLNPTPLLLSAFLSPKLFQKGLDGHRDPHCLNMTSLPWAVVIGGPAGMQAMGCKADGTPLSPVL